MITPNPQRIIERPRCGGRPLPPAIVEVLKRLGVKFVDPDQMLSKQRPRSDDGINPSMVVFDEHPNSNKPTEREMK